MEQRSRAMSERISLNDTTMEREGQVLANDIGLSEREQSALREVFERDGHESMTEGLRQTIRESLRIPSRNSEAGNMASNLTGRNSEVGNMASNLTGRNSEVGNMASNLTGRNSEVGNVD